MKLNLYESKAGKKYSDLCTQNKQGYTNNEVVQLQLIRKSVITSV